MSPTLTIENQARLDVIRMSYKTGKPHGLAYGGKIVMTYGPTLTYIRDLLAIIDRLTTQPQADAGDHLAQPRNMVVKDGAVCDAPEGSVLTERQKQIMLHDYPILAAFHRKYALGSMLPPSCLVCGQTKDFVIKHAELPDIGVCEDCRTPAPVDAEKLARAINEIANNKFNIVIGKADSFVFAGSLLTADIFAVPSSQPTWRTIDSAPKDGTMILLTGKDMYGEKDLGGPTWRVDKGWYEKKEGRWYSGSLSTHFPLLYWMPLPSPPTSPGAVK